MIREITQYTKLSIYGYNSSKFDVCVLRGHLLTKLSNRSSVNIIKTGMNYKLITTKEMKFYDAMNFTTPTPLSNFLKQWKVCEEKGVFWYDFFKLEMQKNYRLTQHFIQMSKERIYYIPTI